MKKKAVKVFVLCLAAVMILSGTAYANVGTVALLPVSEPSDQILAPDDSDGSDEGTDASGGASTTSVGSPQLDIFLRIRDIPGESLSDQHRGEIDVLSFSLGASNNRIVANGTIASGKVQFSDIKIIKHVDKSSPKLFNCCSTGKHIQQGTLSVYRAGKGMVQLEQFILSDMMISSVRQYMNEDGTLLEEVDLSFSRIEMVYTQQDPSTGLPGAQTKMWYDLKQNKGG